MESFKEGLSSDDVQQSPCISQWSEQLIKPSGASNEVNATRQPMAVFWDLESMPIPSSISGREAVARIKSALSPHGDLVQFRAYANIGLGLIPDQTRTDLMLSNCHIIDCPNNEGKKVTDKTIMMDAMEFSLSQANAKTLCFIAGEMNDYVHLVARLRGQQKRRVIVIPKETHQQSTLQFDCDINLCWERDVLIENMLPLSALSSASQSSTTESREVHRTSKLSLVSGAPSDDEHLVIEKTNTSDSKSSQGYVAVSEWADDVKLLRDVIRQVPDSSTSDRNSSAHKGYVGNALRQTYPDRFPSRKALKDFFSKAIQTGIVIESGEGAHKMLRLSSARDSTISSSYGSTPSLSLSQQAPIDLQEMPSRAIEMLPNLPFVLFVLWKYCSKGNKFPPKAFVQSCGNFAILMFRTLADAQLAAAELPFLERNGILVDCSKRANQSKSSQGYVAVSEWADDVKLLRDVIRQVPDSSTSDRNSSAHKGYVGNALRQTYPDRFPSRKALKDFFSKAIQTGIVIESGEGAHKMLRLSSARDSTISSSYGSTPSLSLSQQAPIDLQEMPSRAIEMLPNLPFVLFVLWKYCSKGNKFPPKAFVQSCGNFAILMFRTLADAQLAAAELPFLERNGILVDCSKRANQEYQSLLDDTRYGMVTCTICKVQHRNSLMVMVNDELQCQSCRNLIQSRSENDKAHAVACVQWMLEMMAENDDLCVAENILRKQLSLRHHSSCTSRQHASLWIQDAINANAVMRFKRPDSKSKLISLPQHHQLATLPYPPDCDTSTEERHIENLLWDRQGWMKRTDAIASLKENFESMQSPLMRTKFFLNAVSRCKFSLSKGPYGQTIGLTKEDADAALAIAFPPPIVDERVSVVGKCVAPLQNTSKVLLKAEQKKPTSLLMDDDNDVVAVLANKSERREEKERLIYSKQDLLRILQEDSENSQL